MVLLGISKGLWALGAVFEMAGLVWRLPIELDWYVRFQVARRSVCLPTVSRSMGMEPQAKLTTQLC